MTVPVAAPPRGGSWHLDAGSSLVAFAIVRELPIVTLPSPDREAP